ncbi:MarC family protein [Consotaella aegiceratis]|uniref:MarC family protein n=1 Tax=Consotaella aegiceratis TaxID=3097961 RepID=UPI002F3E823F
MLHLLVNGFVTLFVIIDPLGLVPVFLALTPGVRAAHRRAIALRASLIAGIILSVFAVAGLTVLEALGITLGAFRVAGGVFLFWIAFELVFEKRGERKQKSAEEAVDDPEHDIAAFPLAIPLMAGPGAIAAVILLAGALPSLAGQLGLILVIAAALALSFAVLALAHTVERLLGPTSRAVISRLLGVVLAALAVQFVADGAKELMRTNDGLIAFLQNDPT